MSDIADAIINQSRRDYQTHVPNGYHVDDMGYWVEDDIDEDKARYAEYLLYRIMRKHNDIYKRHGRLYCEHRMLTGSAQEILGLADSPSAHCRAGQAAWIFNRLRETAPETDDTKIMVAPGMYWDSNKAELCDSDEIITTKGRK